MKEKEYKVIITGHFSAGKTSFVNSLTGNALTTEVPLTGETEKLEKDFTTVAMDYGTIDLDGKKVHLFGTPGQERFDFMLDILSKNSDGVIILIDSTKKDKIEETKKFVEYFLEAGIPFIVASNKQDLENAMSIEEISDKLNVPPSYVRPLVAKDKNSSRELLKEFVESIEKQKQT
jgi:small GTP-binding protein